MSAAPNPAGSAPAILPADIRRAAKRLAGRILETPLLDFPLLSERLGFRLLVKAETFQITGSFKFRGASNKLLSELERGRDLPAIVAYSSGNHAQGVAAAARALGQKAIIVMPKDAPVVKVAGTRAEGAKIVFYDRRREDRAAIAGAIAARSGGLIVPPYDDPAVMAGQGTVGLEIAAAADRRGLRIDDVIVPVSGGGLIAGIATAIRHFFPGALIHAAEPKNYDDLRRSLQAGRRLSNRLGPASLCDALMSPMPGELTFPIHRRLVAGGFAVPDDWTLRAMALAARRMKLVLEPGGAVALAAALRHRRQFAGRNVVIVASGGNVDPPLLTRALDLKFDF